LPEDATVEIHVLEATVNGGPTIDALIEASLARKETSMKQLLEGAQLAPIGAPLDPSESASGDREDLRTLLRFLLGTETVEQLP
jgi:hypothetical protein